MIVALILAQVMTMQPAPTVAPTPVSERALLTAGIAQAQDEARRLGGTLGVEIVDLGTGVSAGDNETTPFPLANTCKLPLAVAAYDSVDRGVLKLDQMVTTATLERWLDAMLADGNATAANVVYGVLGGGIAISGRLHALGFDGIEIRGEDDAVGTPDAVASLLAGLERGTVLSAESRKHLMSALTFRSGINDAGIAMMHRRAVVIVALLHGVHGTAAQRDAVVAAVARAADEATQAVPI